MPIAKPARVRTPSEIAATRVAGEPEARCATCSFLLVELPRAIRITLPGPRRAPLSIVLTHAHSTRNLCPECPDDAPDAHERCEARHDALPCMIPEPVPCAAGDCDLPAGTTSDYCAHCGDAR